MGEGGLRVRRRGLITFFFLKTVKKGSLLEGEGGGGVLKDDFRVIQESEKVVAVAYDCGPLLAGGGHTWRLVLYASSMYETSLFSPLLLSCDVLALSAFSRHNLPKHS